MSEFTISITPPEGNPQTEEQHTAQAAEENNNSDPNNENCSDIISLSLEDEIERTKKPREIFWREYGKINQFWVSYNREMKTLIGKIHSIKSSISEVKRRKEAIISEISTWTQTQNTLITSIIQADTIWDADKNEINRITEKLATWEGTKKGLEQEIKQWSDEDLFNAKNQQIQMMKEKKNKIEMAFIQFDLINKATTPLISKMSGEKAIMDKLQEEWNEWKSKSHNEERKNKLKEEIKKSLEISYEQQEQLLTECEKLRIAWDEKMKQALVLNKSINKGNSYIELIDKFGDNYWEIDKKQSEFDTESKNYLSRTNEYTDVLERINTFNTKYAEVADTLDANISIMENFWNIEIIQREQIENYNQEIQNLKEQISLNENKIEMLDLEDKALEAEITPCEMKIIKYESEKKWKAHLKDFDCWPELVNKIKGWKDDKSKYQKQIQAITDEITNLEAENMKLLNDIENKRKLYSDVESELRTENINYIKCYESIINDWPDSLKGKEIKEELKLWNEEIEKLNDEFGEDNTTLPLWNKQKTMRFSTLQIDN